MPTIDFNIKKEDLENYNMSYEELEESPILGIFKTKLRGSILRVFSRHVHKTIGFNISRDLLTDLRIEIFGKNTNIILKCDEFGEMFSDRFLLNSIYLEINNKKITLVEYLLCISSIESGNLFIKIK